MRKRGALWIAGLALAGTLDAAAAMRIWAIGDSVRVNPVSGKAFEDNPMLYPDGLRGNYQESNLIWDAGRKRVSLRAARNETVAFQLIVERTGEEKLQNVSVEIGELKGPGSAKILARNIDLFREWYVNVKTASRQSYTLGTGWYPDALLPCLHWTGYLYPHMYVMPFDVPDIFNNVGGRQGNQALWVDIYVPRDRRAAPAGTYTTSIAVRSDSGRADLELELGVWDFALPEENHLRGNIHTDTDINVLPEDMELKYYQMMRRHRIAMGVLGYAPGLRVSGTEVEIDWKKYDARLSRYLDGSAFTAKYGYSGPGEGVPIELLVLPFDAYPVNLYKQSRGIGLGGKEFKFYRPWPVEPPRGGPTPQYREIWIHAFRAFQKHFDEHPAWSQTRLIVYLLSLDEAYDDISRERMLYYGQLLRDAGTPRLKYRVDGWYPKETMARLAKVLDVAILGLGGWEADMAADLKKQGVDPWFYTGAGWTDGDGLQCRALSWIAWKLGAGSWTLWELDFNALRAWQYSETYPNQNGHGMLVYRGETMGLDEPAASIRLKLLRRGSQDYEYLWLLARTRQGKAAADEVVNSTIRDFAGQEASLGAPGMWKHDPDEWDRMRIRMGGAIEKSKP